MFTIRHDRSHEWQAGAGSPCYQLTGYGGYGCHKVLLIANFRPLSCRWFLHCGYEGLVPIIPFLFPSTSPDMGNNRDSAFSLLQGMVSALRPPPPLSLMLPAMHWLAIHTGVERLHIYWKRAILCLSSSKILTPIPLSPWRLSLPPNKDGGRGGQYFGRRER